MKKKKILISALLSAAIVTSPTLQSLPINVYAEESLEKEVTGNFTILIHSNGVDATLLEDKRSNENIVIPKEVNGYKITKIADDCYQDIEIKELTISSYVEDTGNNFKGKSIGKLEIEINKNLPSRTFEDSTFGEISINNSSVIPEELFMSTTINSIKWDNTLEEVKSAAFMRSTFNTPLELDLGEVSYKSMSFGFATFNGDVTINKSKENNNNSSSIAGFTKYNKDLVLNITEHFNDNETVFFQRSEMNKNLIINSTNGNIPQNFFQYSKINHLELNGLINNIGRYAFMNVDINTDGQPLEINALINSIDEYALLGVIVPGLHFNKEVKEIKSNAMINSDLGEIIFKEKVETLRTYSIGSAKFNKLHFKKGVDSIRSYAIGSKAVDRENNPVDRRFEIIVDGDVDTLGSPFVTTDEASDYMNSDEYDPNDNIHSTYTFFGSDCYKIIVNGNIKVVGSGAFVNLGEMTSKPASIGSSDYLTESYQVVINGNIGIIGESAFRTTTKEDSEITINGNISTVEKSGLAQNGANITINGRLKNAKEYSFHLTNKVVVRDGIENIGEYSFLLSGSLEREKAIEEYNKNHKWYEDDYDLEGYLNSLNIKSTPIDKSIFKNTKIIGESPFISTELPSELLFDEGLISLGESAFANNNLMKVKFPNSLKEIANDSLSGNKIACFTLPKGAKITESSSLDEDGTPYNHFAQNGVELTVFGNEASGHKKVIDKDPTTIFKENTIFTNTCDPEKWEIKVEHLDENGNILKENKIDNPSEGPHTIKAENIDGYKLESNSSKIVNVTNDEPNHTVKFLYKKEQNGGSEISPPTDPKPPVTEPENPEPVDPKPPVTEPENPESVDPKPPVSEPENPEPVDPKPPVTEPENPEPVDPKPPVTEPENPEPVDPKPPVTEPENPEPVDPKPPLIEDNSEDATENVDSDKNTSIKKDEGKTEVKEEDKENLPKAGFNSNSIFGIIGSILLLTGFTLLFKRKRKK